MGGCEPARDLPALADRIRTDAEGAGGVLPRLSFILTELFERDGRLGLLTHAAYDALGGLTGAIATHAEAAWAAFAAGRDPLVADRALGRVLRALATTGERSDAPFTARTVLGTSLADDPDAAALAQALVAARLLVADGPDLRVAHKTVLRSWTRALRQWRGPAPT